MRLNPVKVNASPYLLLVLTTLFWAGNSVLGRMIRLDVPPVGLSFWRWMLAGALLLPFIWRELVGCWPLARAHIGLVLLLAIFGVTGFNTLLYMGLQTTTASNAVLLMSVIPLVIILLSWLLLGVGVTLWQSLGILTSLIGVGIIVARGELDILFGLSVTRGDLWVLAAVVSWGFYSVLLRRLPTQMAGLPLLGYTILFGLGGITPFYLWEIGSGRTVSLDAVTLGSILYVAVFASLLAYLFWNHAVARVGPNKAGQFVHLIPVFGSLLSVLVLGERLHLYHLAGALCIAAGILMASLQRARSLS